MFRRSALPHHSRAAHAGGGNPVGTSIIYGNVKLITDNLIFVLSLVVFVAAFVQGATGFGFAMITAPIIALIAPQLLPVLLLVLMIPLNLYVVWRERHALDIRGAGWIMLGRVAGTAGGLLILISISIKSLDLLIGFSTAIAALVSLLTPSFTPNRSTLISVGVVTGITETATGVAGPPLAMVYQHRPASELRSTVATCFLLGEMISLAVLAVSGKVSAEPLRVSFFVLPALILGGTLSTFIHHRIEGQLVRFLVLGFALLSGVTVALQAW